MATTGTNLSEKVRASGRGSPEVEDIAAGPSRVCLIYLPLSSFNQSTSTVSLAVGASVKARVVACVEEDGVRRTLATLEGPHGGAWLCY